MKYSAILIEDELPARATLKSYLRKYFSMVEVIAEFDTVEESVQYLDNHSADILFLDVQLKDGLGIEILDQTAPGNFRIVFTTAYDDFTKEAFQNKAFGYLLKPLDPNDFKEIMTRILKDLKTSDQEVHSKRIKIPIPSGHTWVGIKDIIRCEAENNYTRLFIKDLSAPMVISKTLKYVENTLIGSDLFFRVHQSHLINLSHIRNREIKNNTISMINGDKIPVSRSRRNELNLWLKTH